MAYQTFHVLCMAGMEQQQEILATLGVETVVRALRAFPESCLDHVAGVITLTVSGGLSTFAVSGGLSKSENGVVSL